MVFEEEVQMSYETVVEQVRKLPESCLAAVSNYLDFLLYQQAQLKMLSLVESEEEFDAKMQKGFLDMKEGHVTPLNESFSRIKGRFS